MSNETSNTALAQIFNGDKLCAQECQCMSQNQDDLLKKVLDIMWKEGVVAFFDGSLEIRMSRLRKTTKYSQ